MKYIKHIKWSIPSIFFRSLLGRYKNESIRNFRFDKETACDVKEDIQKKYSHSSQLLELFVTNKGCVVHKWHHYIPLYDRYFAPYRGKNIRFLEIGVSKGGSLQMWRKYFGEDAIIFGIDIDPKCIVFDGIAGQVRIGSQVDETFLDSVVKEMGGLDIVLDDGSHQMAHIPITLKLLFRHLNYGGIYMIEDLHTAYWKKFGGGYRVKGNFFRLLVNLVNDMHHWYHAKGQKLPGISKECSGIHIHDSIVVLEKNKVYKPVHSRIR